MELDWLETFLAVVDRGGFTAASEQVHRSQSRVSAHIAALERDLGVRLIDRAHRPARLTPAGAIFARHARDIVAGVGSARSAVGTLRGMDQGRLLVLTTACIGAAQFPGLVADLVTRYPGAQVTLAEQSWHDVAGQFPADGAVVAVLPVLVRPLAPGLQERLLWREPIRVVVRPDHDLAHTDRPVSLDELVGHPLVVSGTSAETAPEVSRILGERGRAVHPRAVVGTPQTLVSMVRTGVGVGVANAVALEISDTDGLVVLDIDDPRMVRDVAGYWYDVLVYTGVGRALLDAVLQAPVPPGAVALPPQILDPARPPGMPTGWRNGQDERAEPPRM
ncbi:LysR family transcriptional regulator [Pseudonocardia sp. H11422]|uniref:LysR family transcriptional regulator n=1 Tax=Pseudonocardia sp. H11422 TaxID=2835866 RepID=UPI001BDC2F40|nr:LysR family transcriptional regulator [Pseudonocardia sp. H11422]